MSEAHIYCIYGKDHCLVLWTNCYKKHVVKLTNKTHAQQKLTCVLQCLTSSSSIRQRSVCISSDVRTHTISSDSDLSFFSGP